MINFIIASNVKNFCNQFIYFFQRKENSDNILLWEHIQHNGYTGTSRSQELVKPLSDIKNIQFCMQIIKQFSQLAVCHGE